MACAHRNHRRRIVAERLESRLLLATQIGGRWSPDPLDEAISFRLPLAADTTTHFYFDRDPTAAAHAWDGSTHTYDGHTGSDFSGGPDGKPIYAAADGILIARADGNGPMLGPPNGNYIELNHGNDRNGMPINTFYLHMLAGTPINLPLGTFIAAGTQIGGVGTSGNSTGDHLHFHLSYNGTATDPFAAAGESSWWANQGTGSPSTATPAHKFVIGQYVEVFALTGGGTLTVRSPNATSGSIGVESNGAIGKVIDGPALSTTDGNITGNVYTRWKVQFGNGLTGWVAQNWIKLASPQEISVAQGGTNIADGQAGAISFGSVERGQSGLTRVFAVTNVGNQTLTLGTTPALPAGYSLVEGLSASLAPGASDTFTVRLDSATIGTKSGQISFSDNDSDENPFNFPITGTVTDLTPPTATAMNVSLPGATPLINVSFSEHVIGVDAGDLTITPQGGGSPFHPTGVVFPPTNGATFTFNAPVADGVYHATLPAGSFTDDAGNPNSNAISVDFVLVNSSHNFALPAGTTTVNQVLIGGGGKLDIGANSLVVDYTGASPLSALTSQIASGRNGGDWSGSGIVTTAASGNLTTLGIFDDTAAAQVRIKYTYAGDANLDGKINVDDYGRIDFNVNLPGASGWYNGDFNYDGKVNVDDYGIIDFNIGIQGSPIGSASFVPARFLEANRNKAIELLSPPEEPN